MKSYSTSIVIDLFIIGGLVGQGSQFQPWLKTEGIGLIDKIDSLTKEFLESEASID